MSVTITSTGGPCACCSGLLCRNFQGLASLCGLAPYGTPPSPYNLYRMLTLSGTVNWTYDSNPSVAGVCNCQDTQTTGATVQGWDDAYIRTVSYANAPGCAVTDSDGGSSRYSSNWSWDPVHSACNQAGPVAQPGIPGGYDLATIAAAYAGCYSVVTDSSTQQHVHTSGSCTSGSLDCYIGATLTGVLTDVDTDTQAYGRLFSSSTYGPWGAATPGGCLAVYQARSGTTITFEFGFAQYQATLAGGTPSTLYELSLDLWAAPYGTTMYSFVETDGFFGTTDGAGNLTITVTLNPAIVAFGALGPGYSFYYTNPQWAPF